MSVTTLTNLIQYMMKDNGVLAGLTGRWGNVLKIRPPLVFSKENTDYLIPILDKILTELT